MPKNRQEIPKAEREAAIVAAAGELFGNEGYHATTMAAVARAAGLTSAAVHWYFATKDDLFAAAFDRAFAAARRRVESAPETAGDPRAQLIAILVGLQPFHSLHRAAYERMDESESVRAAYIRAHDWLDDRLLAAVAARRSDAAQTDSPAVIGGVLLEGVLISGRTRGIPIAELVDTLIDALAALPTPRRNATPQS
ncbi:helix-turn-helix domain-containing protein [Mycolicibacterium sp.]|uniref:TetR/AcrR family transcriptional regulator n=1 Tax=Mycolicibacterium sp. TaxID=2320850 RepID=UPI0028ADE233|nr:helix-turn-helix domain-containing protein [Mycolicibacterium sp.]